MNADELREVLMAVKRCHGDSRPSDVGKLMDTLRDLYNKGFREGQAVGAPVSDDLPPVGTQESDGA